MNPKILKDRLKNYRALLRQVDAHIKQVETDYSDQIVCKKGGTLVGFCPKNFKGVTSFPKESLLDLEQLNTLLAAINNQFLTSIETQPIADRIPMSRALLLLDENLL